MGAGKTVLASRIKGHTDLIREGESGFLYDFGNENEFVNKVIEIYNGALAPLGEEIRRDYLKFEKGEVFPETLELIKTAIL
jgi:glycosyltransferase involved in cell wall biosynthesis